jgi:MFS family permease
MGDDAVDIGGRQAAPPTERFEDGRRAGPAAGAGAAVVDPPGRRPVAGGEGRGPRGRRRRGRTRDDRAPYGWWPVAVIIMVAIVDRVESSVLSAILADLQAEWGFSDTAGGSLSAAISIMGTALALPAGYLADRTNRKNLLAFVVALWSFITLGSAVSISFAMFFVTRLALAAADSIDNPSQVSLLADYYSVEVRPKVLGFHRMVTFAGGALGTMYGGIVSQLFGWRAVFYAIIIPGLVVAWWCYRLPEPRRGEADARAVAAAMAAARSAGEGARVRGPARRDDAAPDDVAPDGAHDDEMGGTVDEGEADRSPDDPDTAAYDEVNLTQAPGLKALLSQLGTVLRIRSVVLVYSGLAVLFFGLNGIFFWLPTLYRRAFDLEAGMAGTLTAGITLVGVVGGTWIGGVIGERVHGRIKGGRVVAGASGIILGSLVFPLSVRSDTLTGQAGFLLVAVTLLSIAIPNLQSAIADALPANQRGVGFALLGVFITFGAFGPLLVGAISDATGSLVTAFGYLIGPMALGGVVTMTARSSFDRDVERALEAVRSAAGHGADGAGGGRGDDETRDRRDDGLDQDGGAADPPGVEPQPADQPPTSAEPDPDGPEVLRASLAGVRGLGPARLAALVDRYGTVAALRAADRDDLLEVPGIGPALADAIRTRLEGPTP